LSVNESEHARSTDGDPLDETLFISNAGRRRLETDILPEYIQRVRWFAGKARRPESFAVIELVPIGASWLLVVQVRYADGNIESYLAPLTLAQNAPSGIAASAIAAQDSSHVLYDAIHDRDFRTRLLAMLANSEHLQTQHGSLTGLAGRAISGLPLDADSRVLAVEQSNSSVIYDERLFLKLYRKLESGVNPDAEITRFLSEERKFPHVPAFGGSLELRSHGSEPRVLALATAVVPNCGDAWSVTLQEVAQFYSRACGAGDADVRTLAGAYLDRVRLLGTRTGQMHAALAAPVDDPRFRSEPMTTADLRGLAQSIESLLRNVETFLQSGKDDANRRSAHAFPGDAKDAILAFAARLAEMRPEGMLKTRTHGDYHLGQVLDTGDDFVIIDFEGEPLRPLSWRKEKRSPLRDVAGMLRSFEYAAYNGLEERSYKQRAELTQWTRRWAESAANEFFLGWNEAVRATPLIADTAADVTRTLLRAYLLEKALYEIGYELNNRPAWVGIPMAGVLALIDKLQPQPRPDAILR